MAGKSPKWWSPDALKIWEDISPSTPEVRHHIAVSLHARAFELEQAARAHLDVVSSAPFPRADVQEAVQYLAGTEVALAEAIQSGRFADAIESLEALASIGSAEPEFTRLTVIGYRLECERRHHNQLPFLPIERIDTLIGKVTSGVGIEDERVRDELARVEYWRGRNCASGAPDDDLLAKPYTWWKPDRDSIVDQLSAGLIATEQAAQHFEEALHLYPGLASDPPYSDIEVNRQFVRDKSMQAAGKLLDFLAREVTDVDNELAYQDAARLFNFIKNRPTVRNDASLQKPLERARFGVRRLVSKRNERLRRKGQW